MKKYIVLSAAVLSLAATITSCKNDEPSLYYPTALVTVKPATDSFVLQLNDSVVLTPTNMKQSPFGDKEVRALVNYTTASLADNIVSINWIDSIRTKNVEPSVGADDAKVYGKDPIEIMRDWVTVAEDGYLTLRIRTLWGTPGKTHYLHLLSGTNPDNPFELTLRHDAQGDTVGVAGDALIAFNVREVLQQSASDKQKLTIRWQSFSGPKSYEFEFANAQPKPQNAPIQREAFPYSASVE